jgi:hypothetical protein
LTVFYRIKHKISYFSTTAGVVIQKSSGDVVEASATLDNVQIAGEIPDVSALESPFSENEDGVCEDNGNIISVDFGVKNVT